MVVTSKLVANLTLFGFWGEKTKQNKTKQSKAKKERKKERKNKQNSRVVLKNKGARKKMKKIQRKRKTSAVGVEGGRRRHDLHPQRCPQATSTDLILGWCCCWWFAQLLLLLLFLFLFLPVPAGFSRRA